MILPLPWLQSITLYNLQHPLTDRKPPWPRLLASLSDVVMAPASRGWSDKDVHLQTGHSWWRGLLKPSLLSVHQSPKFISIPQLITCQQEGKMHRATTTTCSIRWGTAAVAGAYLVILIHPILQIAAGIWDGIALPQYCGEDRDRVTTTCFKPIYAVFWPFCFTFA